MYNRRWLRFLNRQKGRKESIMKVFGNIEKSASSVWKKFLDVTGWLAMLVAILAVVGIGGFIITSVMVNYQTLGAIILDGASQIFIDHYGWVLLFNVLIIVGTVIFIHINDKKGFFNWEALGKAKLYASLVGLLVILNVLFFMIVITYLKWSAIVNTFWDIMSNELVFKAIFACELMIILVVIFFVLRIKAEKKSDNGHA